jgi:RNA polymerase primary sigma factor
MRDGGDSIRHYMHDIMRFPLLSEADEVRLAEEIHNGSEEAKKQLIRSNIRLVVKIAYDFRGLGLPLCDLIAEGNMGLIRAADRFDPSKGAKFSSYSSWWIKQAMRRALANQSRTVRVPIQSAMRLGKMRNVARSLTENLGREPTDQELAEASEFSLKTLAWLKQADIRGVSLSDTLGNEESGDYEDVISDKVVDAPDSILERALLSEHLQQVIREHLDEREQTILNLRFGLEGEAPRTLEEVSQQVGCTRERVRQIQYRALLKLRAMLGDEMVPLDH